MALLSNILRPPDARSSAAPRFDCRPVSADETPAAVRLILSGPRASADDAHVAHFLQFAANNDLDLSQLWVAARAGRVVWAVLPVVSPGRTALLSTPGRLPRPADRPAAAALIGDVCEAHAARGIDLAQLLLDPESRDVAAAAESAGFQLLAELLYLRRDVSPVATPSPDLPAGSELLGYAPDLRPRFAAVISASYQGSLDCPALNGRRGMEDVVDGHMAAGEFSPDLWSLLTLDGRDAGCLLLNRMSGGEGVELVYLGLAPWARGRGVADGLIRLALSRAAAEPGRRVMLAVDAANAPALRLYHRHGFRDLYRKLALMRDLRGR